LSEIHQVQRVPSPEPTGAHINTSDDTPDTSPHSALDRLQMFASATGDISDLLTDAELTELGIKAIQEWRLDAASRSDWKERAERDLAIASQERQEDDTRDPLWGDQGSNIYSPLLTIGSLHFAAKASPDLIRGDQVVGVKVFSKPKQPAPIQQPPPQPQNPQQAAQLQQAMQQQAQQAQMVAAQAQQAEEAKNARGRRVKYYLNYLIFYQMDGWEDETDQLLHETPVVGIAYKKVYMSSTSLCSDYVSAIKLVVHNDTKSLHRCPRISQEFEEYPYEIDEKVASGTYRTGARELLNPRTGQNEQEPYNFIEQNRLSDLDGDGYPEPYIVTVDTETNAVLRVECAFTADDVFTRDGKVTRIERWNMYAPFRFLPDMKGRWHGTGWGKLLEPISDSVDTTINQLLDAGTAEIAGGGFISSGVRLQGSGTGGVVTFQPGEYAVANVPAGTLQDSIWERTVPHPSEVSFKLLTLMMDWGKEIMSTQDVVTGDAPSTAPVGTTYALQNQALMSYRACFKRMYRGFREEFLLMYKTVKRFATDKMKQEYQELTGGTLEEDFAGDGTDIQPVADPSVVTKMQKMARNQAVMQMAESELGQAAGMTQPKQAQKIMGDILEDMDVEQPEGYIGDVQPNPEVIAKAQNLAADAAKKQAETQAIPAKLQLEQKKLMVDATDRAEQADDRKADIGLIQAKTLRELGLAHTETHELHKEADRIAQTGSVADAESLMDPAEQAELDREAAAKKPAAKPK
jgi:chaperonin GroES